MGTVAVIAATGLFAVFRGSQPSINPVQTIANSKLQSTVDGLIDFDSRNAGIEVRSYYRNTFDRSVAVFDLHSVSGSQSRLDVFRVFLDFAEALQEQSFEWVVLAYKGDPRFKIEGSYFNQLGQERDWQNPTYTIRSFPENLRTLPGARAYPEWTGGLFGVLEHQMKDFNDFHSKWYLDDMTSAFASGK